MAPIKVRVRTPARMVMVDVDDGVTIAELKKLVRRSTVFYRFYLSVLMNNRSSSSGKKKLIYSQTD